MCYRVICNNNLVKSLEILKYLISSKIMFHTISFHDAQSMTRGVKTAKHLQLFLILLHDTRG